MASGNKVRGCERRTGEQADGWPAASQAHFNRLLTYIGRESNQLEDVDAGLVHASDGAYTAYPDRRRDYCQRVVVPALKQISLKAWQRDTGKSAVILIDARRGRDGRTRNVDSCCSYARQRGVL